jgi:hypothetical protein
MHSFIPVKPRLGRKLAPQSPAVPLPEIGVPAIAEKAEKLLTIKSANPCNLKLEKGVLSEVHVYRMDAPGIVQGVVQCIATR